MTKRARHSNPGPGDGLADDRPAPRAALPAGCRALLLLFPRPFRSRFGDEVVDLIRQQAAESRFDSKWGRVRLWTAVVPELLAAAVRIRVRGLEVAHPTLSPGVDPMSAEWSPVPVTANDRFKRSFSSWLWGSISVATVVHFLVLSLFPQMTAADVSTREDPLDVIPIPAAELPPPPPPIQRPAAPVVASDDVVLSDDVSWDPVDFEGAAELPPPPEAVAEDTGNEPRFFPHDVSPRLRNGPQIQRLLQRAYPALLRDAGIGGTVTLWLYVGVDGTVTEARVSQSSGHRALDEAAIAISSEMSFSPALNRDRTVAVWVQIPLTFEVAGEEPGAGAG